MVRDQLNLSPRNEDERAFLPAHLELTETPLSAAPKWTARLIVVFALLAMLWSWFSKIDIVVVVQGKMISSSHSKVIQPLETAVIESIYMRDGQRIKQRETLLKLKAVGSDSDVAQSKQALQAAWLSKLRYEAVLNFL